MHVLINIYRNSCWIYASSESGYPNVPEMALVALSYMWRVKISIMDILSFDVTRVNHSSEVWWQNAILLCYNGRDHFFSLIPPDGGKIPVTTTQVLYKLCFSRLHCFSFQPVLVELIAVTQIFSCRFTLFTFLTHTGDLEWCPQQGSWPDLR